MSTDGDKDYVTNTVGWADLALTLLSVYVLLPLLGAAVIVLISN